MNVTIERIVVADFYAKKLLLVSLGQTNIYISQRRKEGSYKELVRPKQNYYTQGLEAPIFCKLPPVMSMESSSAESRKGAKYSITKQGPNTNPHNNRCNHDQ